MAVTERWDVPYPVKTDAPEGWVQLKTLADYLELNLGHALEVDDAAARTALGTAIGSGGRGLLVLQVDTSALYCWSGTVWLGPYGAGGGGGGGAGSRGRWAASSAQNVITGESVVAAFGSDLEVSADWLKVTRGDGHGFRAQRAGILSGALVLRYATTTAAGVRDVHVRKNSDYVGSSGGGAVQGQPRHHSVAILPQPIAEDDEVWVDLFNGTGGTRALEPNGGQWVQLSLVLT